MEELRLMHANGDEILIKDGWPAALKSYLIKEATSYYAQVGPKDYILFQMRKIGPFTTWLTDYVFQKPLTLSCELVTQGVEFHNMLAGAGMYSYNKGKVWHREVAGDHNILVNAPIHTVSVFTELPVQTFDLHVEAGYFARFIEAYPKLRPLMEALEKGERSAHYPTKAKSGLPLRFMISQIIHLYKLDKPLTATGCNEQDQLITDLIEKCLALVARPPAAALSNYSFQQTDFEKLAAMKAFIEENLIRPDVLKIAAEKYYLSGDKLTHGFKTLFGLRPKEYLIQQRMDRIKEFIKEAPEASHLEIAMSVGYTDSAYMAKLFQRKEGMRIEEFKERYR